MGFWGDLGGWGEDIWWESISVLIIARFQTSLVQIWRAVQLRKFGQVWGSQLPYQKSQENSAAGRHPFGPSTTTWNKKLCCRKQAARASYLSVVSFVASIVQYVERSFYRAMHMHKRGICRHPVSVRPTVRLFTFVSCAKTNKDIFIIFSPSGSHTILVFPHKTGWWYSDGNPLTGASNARVWKNDDFRSISRSIWETVIVSSNATAYELQTW